MGTGVAKDAATTATDEDRRATRARRGLSHEVVDLEVLALEAHGLPGEETSEDPRVLDHAIDANLGRIHRDPRPLVVETLPPRPQPNLQATPRQLIDRRQLTGENRRVPEIAVEHECSNVERSGDGGRRGQRRYRSEALVEVVRHEQGVVTEILDLPSRFHPGAIL